MVLRAFYLLDDENMRHKKLTGKGILITGGSQGLGKAIARACIDEGADVLLCSRTPREVEESCDELRQCAAGGQRVLCQVADVSEPEAARNLVAAASERLPRFTGVVNNAGINGPKGRTEDIASTAWARTIEINLFGTVWVCGAATPVFRRQGYGKIVNLSGGGATAPMPGFSAYAASKAAVVRFTETLAHETKGDGIDVNAVAPGALNTRMLNEVLEAGPEKVGAAYYEKALQQQANGGAPLEKAAALCVSLLSAETDGITGRLISAVWDPWPTLAARAGELDNSDIYTLRRILPQDRGRNWES